MKNSAVSHRPRAHYWHDYNWEKNLYLKGDCNIIHFDLKEKESIQTVWVPYNLFLPNE